DAREMADDVDLADFRQPREVVVAQQFWVNQRVYRRRFDIESRQLVTHAPRTRTLEDQAFVLINMSACFFDHCFPQKIWVLRMGFMGLIRLKGLTSPLSLISPISPILVFPRSLFQRLNQRINLILRRRFGDAHQYFVLHSREETREPQAADDLIAGEL